MSAVSRRFTFIVDDKVELDVEDVRTRSLRLLLEPAPPWLELFDPLLY